MSGEVVNLRRARKARDRAAEAGTAAANRAKHGRTKAERQAGVAETARGARLLDGHRLGRRTARIVATRTVATPEAAPTAIVKHSLVVAGHRTSISLEDAFWQALKGAAAARSLSLAALVAEIDAGRGDANLSSAIRVHLLMDAGRPKGV